MSKYFYVTFVVTRGGVRQSNVELSYLYNGSKRNLTSDFTDKHGEARTEWQRSSWLNKEIDVFFDGYHKHTIKLMDNDRDIPINLPSGCFPYKTEIFTPFGVRLIGDIKDGDLIFCFNPIKEILVQKRVIKKLSYQPMPIVELHTLDGKSLAVTSTHNLLTTKGYTTVNHLKRGDQLLMHLNSKSYAIVDHIIETDRFEPVYNLIVKDEFNFIANGFVANSFATYPKLQAVLWKAYDSMPKKIQANILHHILS